MDGVKELTHDGNDSLHRGLLVADQLLIERSDVGLTLFCDQGRHEERCPEVAIAHPGDACRGVEGLAGLEDSRVESCVGDPLSRRHVLGQDADLSEDLDRAGRADASD